MVNSSSDIWLTEQMVEKSIWNIYGWNESQKVYISVDFIQPTRNCERMQIRKRIDDVSEDIWNAASKGTPCSQQERYCDEVKDTSNVQKLKVRENRQLQDVSKGFVGQEGDISKRELR